MLSAPIPPDERERLASLHETGLLDTPAESAFDDLVNLAAQICGVPIVLVSLVDERRQWFKSRVGLDATETPREVAFCAHAILDDELFVVPDAHQDVRFADNPLVVNHPHVRFYAGAPLRLPDGHRIGTLCAVDHVPRRLTEGQLEALRVLGRQVVGQIELRRQARALHRLGSLQRAILDSTTFSIISTDARGVIQTFNAGAENLLGYRAEELVGRARLEMLHDSREVQQRAAVLSRELGTPIAPGFEVFVTRARAGRPEERVWTYLRRDGSRVPVFLSVTALRGPVGGVSGYLAVAHDVTEREEVDRLKNEFVSTVSHELRTPLTSIRGAIGLLEGGMAGELPAEAHELVRIATNNCDRLIRLVNDILDLEKMEAGRLELKVTRLEANDLVEAALSGLAGFAELAGVTLERVPGPPLLLEGDRDRLIQVLTNLVANAVKFSPRGGTVEVRVDASAPGRARLSVRDQGPGIPAHQLPRLFGRFQQLDSSDSRAKGGTGLGLAISKALVEQHGGTIWAESEVGRGATFHFELPSRTVTLPDHAAAESRRRALPVLVVEDDQLFGQALESTLESLGYSPRLARTLAEAEELLARERPAVVILDVMLPDGSGLEWFTRMRMPPRSLELPVVVLSGQESPEHFPHPPQLVEWIAKPFEEQDLAAVLRRSTRAPGPARILLVDDDEGTRKVLNALLTGLGAEITEVGGGEEAVRCARALSPDLIVLDVEMPQVDGFDVVARLRHDGAGSIPLIVYSGRDLSEGERAQLVLGATRHFTKARVTDQQFLAAVRQTLGKLVRREAA